MSSLSAVVAVLASGICLAACSRKTEVSRCTPRSCSAAAVVCGQMEDGCGGVVACDRCAAPQSCGGGGVLGQCGVPGPEAPVVVAVGDIACGLEDRDFSGAPDACQMRATAKVASSQNPAAALLLGDIQYPNGSLEDFRGSFAQSWSALKERVRPALGNHEYRTRGAAGYFDYFGAGAGVRHQGYYAFDLGAWHVIALNSNCDEVGGCGWGSPQLRWLIADLARHPRPCTLAYWHHPRFSSGRHGNNSDVGPLWAVLQTAGAEVVLTGHDHHYERFAPMAASGERDDAHGIREFIVGTGGKSLYPLGETQPNSEVRFHQGFGLLRLVLRPDSYDWRFVSSAGAPFTDEGHGVCH